METVANWLVLSVMATVFITIGYVEIRDWIKRKLEIRYCKKQLVRWVKPRVEYEDETTVEKSEGP